MTDVARLFADTIRDGGTIFITGCSHSSIFAQEVFYRAGGLMLINPIFLPGMTLENPPPTRTSKYERISGIAESVLSESAIRAGDILVIASISGRNIVPIEMAIWAREHGVRVVALTSSRYSGTVPSRHASGKRLFELADIILDVLSPPGDAVLDIAGLTVRTAPTSTVIGIAILHSVIAQAIEILIEYGLTPPVFMSANLDGGDAHNAQILEQYKDRIHYM
ncbi:SIS domain-containing protein [Cohnella sp. CBP 2801]|uniref:SIS domain-containing protein n=2 Tax=Cohnella zeiphila TaxID=2761120 RepID=A0A7X0SJ26_9BACL|nr:SIS domain-containing protein [Cohnella zeiphila]